MRIHGIGMVHKSFSLKLLSVGMGRCQYTQVGFEPF